MMKMNTVDEKYRALQNIFTEMGSVVVAFSGGVDSTFVLKVAADQLGDRVLAATERSAVYSPRETKEATEFAASLGVEHLLIDDQPLDDEQFVDNPPDRCYWCKKRLLEKLINVARERGFAHVADGSNVDDLGDYRPGSQAVSEYGVRSPLCEAGLTKPEIRELSRRLNLPTWDKPAAPCLASRFPYGSRITAEGLDRVHRAEEYLTSLGLRELRVRDHGQVARIEVPPADKQMFFDEQRAQEIVVQLKAIGYAYVCLDLLGYRMGSMNEVLTEITNER